MRNEHPITGKFLFSKRVELLVLFRSFFCHRNVLDLISSDLCHVGLVFVVVELDVLEALEGTDIPDFLDLGVVLDLLQVD